MTDPATSDFDDVIRRALARDSQRHPVVVFDGPPLSGLSRTMLETAKKHLPDATIVCGMADELAEMVHQDAFDDDVRGPSLVWIDDAAPSDLVLLQPAVLDRIRQRATVLINIDSAWCDRLLTDNSPLTAPARAVLLEHAERIHIPFAMSTRERTAAEDAMPHIAWGDSIAESLVGGNVVKRRYLDSANTQPDGHALARIAIDARRAGIHHGLTSRQLRLLFTRQHKTFRWSRRYRPAFDWATHIPAPDASVSVVQAVDDRLGGGWSALAYLAASDDGRQDQPARPIPANHWTNLLLELTKGDAFNVAVAAHLRGLPDVTETALRRAAGSSNTAIADHADTALAQLKVTNDS